LVLPLPVWGRSSILICSLAIPTEEKTPITEVKGPYQPSGSIDTVEDPALVAPDEKKLEAVDLEVSTDSSDDEYEFPTEEESQTLRKVPGNLPMVAFALCLVEFAERASYYGSKTVFSNFIEFPLPKGMYSCSISVHGYELQVNQVERITNLVFVGGNGAGAPPRHTQETGGALGMGLQAASGLTLLFTFLSYVLPIFGGWWADVRVGRYKAIIVGVAICGVAHVIQIFGAIPSVLRRGASNAAPPFVIGMLLLAFGAGIFKPNIAPTVLDQNRQKKAYIKTLKSGERVIVDPESTTTRTMLIFYGFINAGAFFMLATTYSEKYVGFWLAFLIAGVIYFLLPILLFAVYKKTYKAPPAGNSELSRAFKISKVALRQNKFQIWRKDFWEAAKPANLREKGIVVDWTDNNVRDVSRAVSEFPRLNIFIGYCRMRF
jgi:dipeptide/tripeptide permease